MYVIFCLNITIFINFLNYNIYMSSEDEIYKQKYLKYKKKYLELKEQQGGVGYSVGTWLLFFSSNSEKINQGKSGALKDIVQNKNKNKNDKNLILHEYPSFTSKNINFIDEFTNDLLKFEVNAWGFNLKRKIIERNLNMTASAADKVFGMFATKNVKSGKLNKYNLDETTIKLANQQIKNNLVLPCGCFKIFVFRKLKKLCELERENVQKELDNIINGVNKILGEKQEEQVDTVVCFEIGVKESKIFFSYTKQEGNSNGSVQEVQETSNSEDGGE